MKKDIQVLLGIAISFFCHSAAGGTNSVKKKGPVAYSKTEAITPWKLESVHPWKDPKIKISPPPQRMGKQMGSVDALGLQPLGYELDGDVKVFRLVAQPVEKIMADGNPPSWLSFIKKENRAFYLNQPKQIYKKIKCWGFNGSMPGPTLEATEGDRIRVVVKNELPEPMSIHWHGLEIPNDQDGAAGITQSPIMPGQTYTYEFTLHQVGTYIYHSGFNMAKQDHFGLQGIVVIHPKKYEHKIDKDVTIMLQEWSILPGNEFPNLSSMGFNWATFNGFSAPSIPPIVVNQGDRVRIRFANIVMDSHPIHIHGYRWQEVGTDGGPIPKTARRKSSTINVPPGTTRDVEFVAWNPGVWRLHCHKLHHIVNGHKMMPMGIMPPGGMFTIIRVLPKDPGAPWRHPRDATVDYQATTSAQAIASKEAA